MSSAVPVGVSSGARCHMTASTAHVEKGRPPGGGVHLDGPLWARPPHAGRVEHPSDHVRRQDQHHSRGFHNDPLCGSAVAALCVCKATAAYPVWVTRSTASWMFTLPRAVSSRTQPCASP